MPFKSERQRRYMHVHVPGIAKQWEHKYGTEPKRKKLRRKKHHKA